MNNLILIGMPGCGKSTIGVILAKTLGYGFCDTDLVICDRAGMTLQDILNIHGLESFLKQEEQAVLSLDCIKTVIATGGSVILSKKAMEKLAAGGNIIYLDVPLAELEARITNITTRGIAFAPNQTLKDLYAQRTPLYKKWANMTVSVTGSPLSNQTEAVVEAIVEKLAHDQKGVKESGYYGQKDLS